MACEGVLVWKENAGNGAVAVGCRECLRAWREGPLAGSDSMFAAGLKDSEAILATELNVWVLDHTESLCSGSTLQQH